MTLSHGSESGEGGNESDVSVDDLKSQFLPGLYTCTVLCNGSANKHFKKHLQTDFETHLTACCWLEAGILFPYFNILSSIFVSSDRILSLIGLLCMIVHIFHFQGFVLYDLISRQINKKMWN